MHIPESQETEEIREIILTILKKTEGLINIMILERNQDFTDKTLILRSVVEMHRKQLSLLKREHE